MYIHTRVFVFCVTNYIHTTHSYKRQSVLQTGYCSKCDILCMYCESRTTIIQYIHIVRDSCKLIHEPIYAPHPVLQQVRYSVYVL